MGEGDIHVSTCYLVLPNLPNDKAPLSSRAWPLHLDSCRSFERDQHKSRPAATATCTEAQAQRSHAMMQSGIHP